MNTDELWKTVQGDLQVELSAGKFSSFISQTKLAKVEENENRVLASLAATSNFHRKWIVDHCEKQIKDAFERATRKHCELQFILTTPDSKPSLPLSSYGPLFSAEEDSKVSYRRSAAAAHLRPDFTFEQFAVSSTNEMAYAAAQAVSRNPGQAYHLLFLFGGVGVGKTHLMQGIGHRILEADPQTKVMYRSSEEFTNEIVEAIQYKTTAEFRKRYRSVKALMLDDIQFIGGKDKVQEEFFHTFNAIHQEGGQIVLTSDKFPSEILGLEARLKSRFEGGLTIDIQQPSFELRAAIVLIKAKAWGIDVPMDAAQLIAGNIESTRFLEGVLKRLLAETQIHGNTITLEVAEKVVKSFKTNMLEGNNQIQALTKASPNSVISAVCEVFGIKPAEIKGERRQKDLIIPRHLAMYILKTEAQLPLVSIGRIFGGRDHSTVIHATDKITAELASNAHLRGALDEVRKRMV
ncbi:chromosomal replication initiator protein DnaA [Candidatus Collierbacteria bacterium]|nr:chromosomal replication initiator protein DnaA [Candidatus Collierbacteria bacterium]